MLNLLNHLETRIKNIIIRDCGILDEIIEIRLRINSPVLIKTLKREFFLDESIVITKKDIDDILGNLTKNSIQI